MPRIGQDRRIDGRYYGARTRYAISSGGAVRAMGSRESFRQMNLPLGRRPQSAATSPRKFPLPATRSFRSGAPTSERRGVASLHGRYTGSSVPPWAIPKARLDVQSRRPRYLADEVAVQRGTTYSTRVVGPKSLPCSAVRCPCYPCLPAGPRRRIAVRYFGLATSRPTNADHQHHHH